MKELDRKEKEGEERKQREIKLENEGEERKQREIKLENEREEKVKEQQQAEHQRRKELDRLAQETRKEQERISQEKLKKQEALNSIDAMAQDPLMQKYVQLVQEKRGPITPVVHKSDPESEHSDLKFDQGDTADEFRYFFLTSAPESSDPSW